jgi:putative membrane protein
MMMMGMMGFALLIPLLLIGAVVVFALGWRPQFNQAGPANNSQSPAEILKARYAGGEISREEFEQISRDLNG